MQRIDPFDEYARWLRLLLPKAQREDIIRELSEEYHAQVGEREEQLGRTLTYEERAAIVAQFGHPLRTAARYWPQRHLIGPMLFPFYWPVLRLALGVVVVVNVVSAAVLLAAGSPFDAADAAREAWASMLTVFAWLTVAFAIAERQLTRSGLLERWHPSVQPPGAAAAHAAVADAMRGVDQAVRGIEQALGPMMSGGPRRDTRMRRGSSLGSRFVTQVILSGWWLLALRFPVLMFGGAAAIVEWGPTIDRLYPMILLAQVLWIADGFAGVADAGARSWWRRIGHVLILVNSAAFLWIMATSDLQWVVWRPGEPKDASSAVVAIGDRLLPLIDFLNGVLTVTFGLAVVSSVVHRARRLWRGSQRGATDARARTI